MRTIHPPNRQWKGGRSDESVRNAQKGSGEESGEEEATWFPGDLVSVFAADSGGDRDVHRIPGV